MSKLFGDMKDFGAEPQKENPVVPKNHESSDAFSRVRVGDTTPIKSVEYVLVTLGADYADEFDVSHAWTMTKGDYDDAVKETKKYFDENGETEIYFGTNEYINVSDFDDYMSNLSVENISKEDYETFNRMFGGSFGMFGHYFPYGDY